MLTTLPQGRISYIRVQLLLLSPTLLIHKTYNLEVQEKDEISPMTEGGEYAMLCHLSSLAKTKLTYPLCGR